MSVPFPLIRKEKTMRFIRTCCLLLLVMVVLAACGGGNRPADTPTPVAESPIATSATPGAAQAKPTSVPPTPTPEPEEPLDESRLKALEELNSFRTVMVFTVKGTGAEGKPMDSTLEITTEYVRDADARHVLIRFTDHTASENGQNVSEVYHIGRDVYLYGGEDVGWMRVSEDRSPLSDPDFALLTNGDVFTSMKDMERVRPDETVNGVASRHYRFTEKMLGKLIDQTNAAISAQGDVWIARDGDYITRYRFLLEVKNSEVPDTFSGLTNGTAEVRYDLTDVNKPIHIALPEAAKAGVNLPGFEAQAFPIPPEATTQMAGSGMLMLVSPWSPAEVAAFYEETLSGLGWVKNEQGSMSFEDMQLITFTRDNLTLSISIFVDSGTNQTSIAVRVE